MKAAASSPSPRRAALSLHARVSLVLCALVAALLLAAGFAWVSETRNAIREETEAAGRVAGQWLTVLARETDRDPAHGAERLMTNLREVGRLRSNVLEVIGADGSTVYQSPASAYKAGRDAPAWFANWLAPLPLERRFDAGEQQLVLRPDSSRSVLDAWDELVAMSGWALAALALIAFACHHALRRALAPLHSIDAALARGADGLFDRRLPALAAPELDRLAQSYNRLAERLDDTLADNQRLEEDQRFARALQARLEEERRIIARELHDELAQGITAVRAIAGAIGQRSADQPGIHGSAQTIVAMTGQMQDGVRAILHRLRPPTVATGARIDEAVAAWCAQWGALYPQIQVDCRTEAPQGEVTDEVALTVQRLLQEGLTNVARHAGASTVSVSLACSADAIELSIADNGCGLAGAEGDKPRFGLTGMQERVLDLGGELHFETAAGGGLCVRARLPLGGEEKVCPSPFKGEVGRGMGSAAALNQMQNSPRV
ncbi:putative two-component sensor histidine kinase [Azoarcus olearius]|uniref:sensor histidine kinase n=1 Tax=Azoarcus sp. (strain BH72) TaxID=418699 RepID=UPI0008062EB1|nr:sensor histidine kinase [Azoarcus olearius]ANQ86142.1 putative two-component sensor histidine kinase [Azoarcus olearius]